jgi:LysR family glycine cleavage system transcriptional activator
MTVPSHLKSLQALELAARTGSFAAAADILAITPAAGGQRVKVLEDYLGIALLERGRAGIRPTDELLRALPDLREGFAALEAASAALDLERAREIHIATATDFADLWLRPRLDAFRAAHPNIRFSVNGEGDAPLRLARVDCEIVFAPASGGESEDVLFRDVVLPIASPAIVARVAALDRKDQLEGFPLLHTDFYRDDPAVPSWPRWCATHGVARTAPERGPRFQRIAATTAALAADAGVALCGVALLSDAAAAGRVEAVFPDQAAHASSHVFLARYRDDAAGARTIQRFRAWLLGEARATARWVETIVDGRDLQIRTRSR